MEQVVYTAIILFGSPTLTVLLSFFMKERIKSYLFVDAQKDINTHKQELDTYTESMKHSLQREMAKVEHSTRSKFYVYPKAYARLLKAHGKIACLYGLKFTLDRKNSNAEDVRYALESRNVLKGEVERIVKAFESEPSIGLNELENMLRELEIGAANVEFTKARNYLLLNELFMSEAITSETTKVLGNLNNLRATALTAHASRGSEEQWVKKFFEQEEAIPQLLNNLRDAMRKELNPMY